MRIALALLLVVAACKGKSDRAPATENKAADSVGEGGSPNKLVGLGSAQPTPTPAEPASPTPTDVGAPTAMRSQYQKIDTALESGGTATFASADDAGAPAVHDPKGSGAGPPGKITIVDKTGFDKTTLAADLVAAKIQAAYLAPLERCLRDRLAHDATFRGKAALTWTVLPDGAVGQPKARSPETALDSCFTQAMATWRFPIPKDSDGEPTEAGFVVTLQLAPE